jgi:aspartate-semialdehyde dehydrogenase
MDKKVRVAILGATGMVGQHFVTLLENHPWFELVSLAASPRSAGKSYYEAVEGRWAMQQPIPEHIGHMQIRAVQEDAEAIAEQVDMVFCALDLGKPIIRSIEELYAGLGVAVVSNNSAHRWTDDVPMIIPEVNPEHLKLIEVQRKNRGWDKGLIVVKPNCSIQSYVLVLTALKQFQPTEVAVTSLQAISGAGKTFHTWPEMVDNVIPYIDGEEEKSVNEPLKIWGWLGEGSIVKASAPQISATCIRVPVSDGHMASVSVNFANNPSRQVIMDALQSFSPTAYRHNLPSQPAQLFHIFEEPDRPQTKLDRDLEHGFAVSIGRLRQDTFFDWDFMALTHNTLRGAAGGAVLTAELLVAEGYVG